MFVLINLCFAVICLTKGKYWTGFFGVFVPIVGVVGAIRVARPNSPWAHRRYVGKPRKVAKAQRREDHVNATWRAWREAFFDLIAGKPHLPSVAAAAKPAELSEPAELRDRQITRRRRRSRPRRRRPASRSSQAPPATICRSSMKRRCAGTMASRAAGRSNQAARSTSGNSVCLPERGGHSSANVLLTTAAGSQSCSTAQA